MDARPGLAKSEAESGRRVAPPWRRAGAITGALWIPVGLAVAIVGAQAGLPRASGWLFLLAGPVILRIVGQRFGLHGRRAWLLAGATGLLVLWLIGAVLIWGYAMAGCPGSSPGC